MLRFSPRRRVRNAWPTRCSGSADGAAARPTRRSRPASSCCARWSPASGSSSASSPSSSSHVDGGPPASPLCGRGGCNTVHPGTPPGDERDAARAHRRRTPPRRGGHGPGPIRGSGRPILVGHRVVRPSQGQGRTRRRRRRAERRTAAPLRHRIHPGDPGRRCQDGCSGSGVGPTRRVGHGPARARPRRCHGGRRRRTPHTVRRGHAVLRGHLRVHRAHRAAGAPRAGRRRGARRDAERRVRCDARRRRARGAGCSSSSAATRCCSSSRATGTPRRAASAAVEMRRSMWESRVGAGPPSAASSSPCRWASTPPSSRSSSSGRATVSSSSSARRHGTTIATESAAMRRADRRQPGRRPSCSRRDATRTRADGTLLAALATTVRVGPPLDAGIDLREPAVAGCCPQVLAELAGCPAGPSRSTASACIAFLRFVRHRRAARGAGTRGGRRRPSTGRSAPSRTRSSPRGSRCCRSTSTPTAARCSPARACRTRARTTTVRCCGRCAASPRRPAAAARDGRQPRSRVRGRGGDGAPGDVLRDGRHDQHRGTHRRQGAAGDDLRPPGGARELEDPLRGHPGRAVPVQGASRRRSPLYEVGEELGHPLDRHPGATAG